MATHAPTSHTVLDPAGAWAWEEKSERILAGAVIVCAILTWAAFLVMDV